MPLLIFVAPKLNNDSFVSAENPIPKSFIKIEIPFSSNLENISILPPEKEYLIALMSIFLIAKPIDCLSIFILIFDSIRLILDCHYFF